MPGEALQVNVGEQGGNGDDGGNGGFNGGGDGIAGQGGGNGTAGSCGDGGDGPGLGGGAGGGGWFGGGGGGGNDNTNPGGVSGGGGGGSGLGPAGTAFETGVREGYGLVAITFDPAASTCGAAMAPAPGPAPVAEADPRFTEIGACAPLFGRRRARVACARQAPEPGALTMDAYLPILTMICLVIVFIAASFMVSQVLGPKRPNAAKEAPYESGIVPEQEPTERFPVRFYLVAMTFIVLDVEIIFLYPFTTVFRSFVPGAYGLVVMGVFLLALLVPFAYLLSTGALDWGPARRLRIRLTADVRRAAGKPGATGLDPTSLERETEAA